MMQQKNVVIPNQEIADAFADATDQDDWGEIGELIQESDELLDATLRGDSAIRQIHENRYDGDLKKYFENLLLVGINYDKNATGVNAKKHSCVIEKV